MAAALDDREMILHIHEVFATRKSKMFYINRLGFKQSKSLCGLERSLWRDKMELNCQIRLPHCPTKFLVAHFLVPFHSTPYTSNFFGIDKTEYSLVSVFPTNYRWILGGIKQKVSYKFPEATTGFYCKYKCKIYFY